MFSTLKLYGALAAVVLAIAALLWYGHGQRQSVRDEIQRQNTTAGDKADDARNAYDLCVDAGRVYDFATGKCRGS